MARLSDAQIERAKSVDVLSYLQTYEPDAIRKSGLNEYCLKEHDSLKISNGKFHWFSRGIGGVSALDFLVKVRGIGFADAVETLTGDRMAEHHHDNPPPKAKPPPKPDKPFTLPAANVNNDRVIAYLRGRGISKGVIYRCINTGLLYESAAHRCVFVGKDGDIPRFACERGTEDGHKKDVLGSDKRFSFCLSPVQRESHNLIVTESPIDALAHFCIHEMGQTGFDAHRLSLGGVGSAALTAFWERHPEIKNVCLALDNDKAGKDATKRIIGELLKDKRFSNLRISISPAPIGKDYAETLSTIRQMNIEKQQPNRQQADFSL